MEKSEALRDCVLFRTLSRREASSLERIATPRHVPKGSILFFEGDEARGFYVLLSGRLKLYKASPEGREYTLHHVRSGEMFAEAAIFRGQTYPANCVALEDSDVAFFPKEAFYRLIESSPDISLKVIVSLSKWLRELAERIEDLSLREVPARLAAYLLREAESSPRGVVELEVSKAELAKRLGTVAETLSRSLTSMKESGIIREEGNAVSILDPARLRSIAAGEKIGSS